MNLNLENKNALVGGSTQGLGWATAVELALLGANVTLLARDEEKLKARVGELDTSKGQRHGYAVADFSDPETLKTTLISYQQRVSTTHILVNNTGGPPAGSILDATPEAFLVAFSAHLICNQLLVQALVPGMKTAGFGRIVNIISTSVKQPLPGLGVSNTIRGAVAQWAKTLAGELGPFGITVNNVLPGYTRTARLDSLVASRAKAASQSIDEMEQNLMADIPVRRFG
ncbi:MAG: SDR family NAD(P)-dependent oxidoreductase, partial [Sphingobacteriaceae bacterium]|nr:SDR family NAD(P)-dependent oxidoreductase [Cytophagaceae bacterium]